jgi:hypothetical protein
VGGTNQSATILINLQSIESSAEMKLLLGIAKKADKETEKDDKILFLHNIYL